MLHEIKSVWSCGSWVATMHSKCEAPKGWTIPKFSDPEWDDLVDVIRDVANDEDLDLWTADCEDITLGW